MASNLVSLVMQIMTPDKIERIGAAVGVDRNVAQCAVGASVPGLLAALSSVASQPRGAQKLADAAESQSDTLGSLAGMLAGGRQSSVMEKGSRLLSWLLGGGNRYALTEAVGKFVGVTRRASGSLLGMLTPVVLGAIVQQQGARALNADSVTGLLTAQKDNIAAAFPLGFGNLLAGAGLLDPTGSWARSGPAARPQTPTPTASEPGAVRRIANNATHIAPRVMFLAA